MSKRILLFLYGAIGYAVFLATFLAAMSFVGGFALPSTLDSPTRGPIGEALAWDAALLALFALQHSIMARKWFKDRWTRIVPKPIERATYVWASSLALLLLMWQWRPIGVVIWDVQEPALRISLRALFGFGWGLVLVSTFLINHFDLFGLRQVWLHLRGEPYRAPGFATPGLYRFVRHPLYVGWLFAFWMTPTMTLAHLVFAIATTAYILLAIRFEERDLVREHGAAYENYRRVVPMLIPRAAARKRWKVAGAAAFAFFLVKGLAWLAVPIVIAMSR
jgi:protein-S-isoprenylcysteine O-methyltransferase Ste14